VSGIARVGLVGLGKMGAPMLRHLLTRGLAVTAFDSDRERLASLAADWPGKLRAAASLAELVGCDTVITMLPNSRETNQVLAEGENPLIHVLRPDALVIDMGSSDPVETTRLAGLLNAAGIQLVDAPVSGSVAKAESGQLSIMVGADSDLLERARPLLEVMGSIILPTGRVGSAHAMKALNNYVYAAGLLASCEALLAVRAMGLDADTFVDVLNASSGRNVATETKLRQFILSGSFSGGFSLPLQAKDLATAKRLGDSAGLGMPQLSRVASLWSDAVAVLPAEADNTAIYRYLETLQASMESV
jgi:3-hydroxyisobutyrate dehydrogenase|tara:strand:+ start:11587 stop:12495 length:909 start_codon:yes stop_codon:yes gene_type:complete